MSKRSIGGIAIRTYPRQTREARGEEMLGTLLDAGDDSLVAFLRQLVSLVVGGFVARSRLALTASPARFAAEVSCWVAIVTVMRFPFGAGIYALRRWSDGADSVSLVTIRDMYVLPLVILASFTFGRRRLTALLGLVWVFVFFRTWVNVPIFRSGLIEMLVLPALGFVLLAGLPSAMPTPWQARIKWLIPATAWALIHLLSMRISGQPIVILLPILVSLLALPVAPALAVGTALAWSATSLWMGGVESPRTVLSLACAAMALAFIAVGHRRAIRS